MHSSCLFRIAAILVISGILGEASLEAKNKDDVVVMKNGDRFTGEIKKLENGVLYFKADYMVDPVQLDWARVERLESKDHFNVFFSSGKRVTGSIEFEMKSPDTKGGVAVHAGTAATRAPPSEIVSLVPMEDSFWAQLAGSIDYGLTFTGGKNATQSSLSGEVAYGAEKWRAQMSGSSVLNYQSGAKNSGRNTLNFLYLKSVNDRWFGAVTANLLSSDQQDLTLRTSAGGGIGRDILRSGTSSLLALGGVAFSNERYSVNSDQSNKHEAEAQFRILFSKYVFRRLQFNGEVDAYPNLTTLGRVRLGTESNLKLELIRNLYWKLSVYENYDNRPPVNAPKNDFGTSTSFGWKF
jgi:hypothetical protein